MSGIAGAFQSNGKQLDPVTLDRLSDQVQSLGPDRSGRWIAPRGDIALFHSLLQIAPEDEFDRQPLIRPGLVSTSDARLDNRAPLLRELEILGEKRRTSPDCDLILAAYEKWGTACPNHLSGDFAFGIWDVKRERLFCARDHLGNIPLYYVARENLFAFSTVARHLLCLSGVSKELCQTKIADRLMALPDHPDLTFYEAVRCLPPGHSISITRNSVRKHQYWSLEDIQVSSFVHDEALMEEFRAVLDDAVSSRIQTEARVGSFLSGGLDSPSVAVMAAQKRGESKRKLWTYTSVPRYGFHAPKRRRRFSDERPLVEAIVSRIDNLKPHFITVAGRSLSQDLGSVFPSAGPPRNVFNLLWDQAIGEEASSHQVKVQLTGGAGNICMSRAGTERLLELALRGNWFELFREIKSFGLLQERSMSSLIGSHVFDPLLAPLAARVGLAAKRGCLRETFLNQQFVESERLEERYRQSRLEMQLPIGKGRREVRLRRLARFLGSVDRDHSSVWKNQYRISLRDPTRDLRLVTFCLGVAESQYLRDGWDRSLVRRSMAPMLPECVAWNCRRGLQSSDWAESFDEARGDFDRIMARLERSDLCAYMLDLSRIKQQLQEWSTVVRHDLSVEKRYRDRLTNALVIGAFICWHEDT